MLLEAVNSSITRLDPRQVRDLAADCLDAQMRLRVMPASYYAATSLADRAAFCVRHGLYLLPTVELVAWLAQAIDGRPAIEIGAGNGVLASALGIRATDSRMQDDPAIAALYAAQGQATVRYGANVERLAADKAVRRYRPEVVIAAWVTHRYDPARHAAGGNMFGVDEADVLAHCRRYIVIGNTSVHAGKSLWRLAHMRFTPPWLYSRAFNGSADFIAVWGETAGLPVAGLEGKNGTS